LNLKENLQSQTVAIAFSSFALFTSWIFLILSSRSAYYSLIPHDPLAMINVLFPFYWIIVLLFVLICFFVSIKKSHSLWLHIFLLAQLSLMLYYTPFLLGGFSWSVDSLWHGGVARYMPSILSGVTLPLTDYAQSYPLSYLITYATQQIFSLDIVTYTLYIFPPICIVLISSLAYFFSSRITNYKTAFMAMIIALPSFHYIEPHVSPFASGTVITIAALILLTYKSFKALSLSFFLIIILTLTHPISPIFLALYLASILIVYFLFNIKKRTISSFFVYHFDTNSKNIVLIKHTVLSLSFLLAIWFYWTIFQAAPRYHGIDMPLSKFFNLNFLSNLLDTFQWTAGGQGFIYSEISQLSLIIYGIFLMSTSSILFFDFLALLIGKKRIQASPLRLRLTFTALGSVILGYLLFATSGERFLLGRGLIFFLFMGSICMATIFVNAKFKKMKIILFLIFILFLFTTFPVISYSKEAYNTYTPSAEAGLVFLSNNIDLSKQTLSMTGDRQLAAYADLTEGLKLKDFPPLLNLQQPEIIVLRLNAYYVFSMRYDFSYTNNSYIMLQNNLTQNENYNKVYSNGNFESYVKIN
jgi:hypothetical protein